MAERDYVRLAAACHCGEPVKLWTGRGRKPKYCGEHATVPTGPKVTEPGQRWCSVPKCGAGVHAKGFCVAHYFQNRAHGAAGPREQSCKCCGKSFHAPRTKMYCSQRCCWVAQGRKKGSRPKAEALAAIRRPANWFTCEHCGKDAHRNLSGSNRAKGAVNRWCSMECKLAQAARERAARPPPEPTGVCTYHALNCASCSLPFGTRNPDVVDCASCRALRRAAATKVAALALHRAMAHETACEECGIRYCRLFGVGSMPMCPGCATERARAQKRVARTTRKAKLRAVHVETVDPIKVFERAGWKCYLCGCATPQALRGTYEQNAPELDHIHPLSRGGAHSYANTDGACRACNLEKGAQTLDELLA